METEHQQRTTARHAQRQSLRRLREKIQARGGSADGGPHRREDLIRLGSELVERELAVRARADLADRERLCEAHLGTDWTGIAVASAKVTEPHVNAVLRLIGQQLAQWDDVEFTGAKPDSPPAWIRLDLGGEIELVPSWATIYWDAETVVDVPIVLETFDKAYEGQILQVFSRAEDHGAAKRYLNGLIDDARGPQSPYRGRLLKATLVAPMAVHFDILPNPVESRDRLVLPEPVWDALDVNVHRMFARMHLFEQAGLGSNRGVLVAGPPGTGKTAACRVLAAEVLERATAIFVDSMIAQALLPSLYQEISGLGPTLVLVEDLDLIVGSRDDETARRPLLDFLTVLDGLMTQHRNVVTVATTNDPAAVDAGVRRAARFDRVVMFPIPDEDGRRRILDVYLASVPHEVDTRAVARATDGATGADLREYVRGALLTASDVVTTADVLATIEPGHDAPDRTSPRTAGKYL
jgi:hypothetical protein